MRSLMMKKSLVQANAEVVGKLNANGSFTTELDKDGLARPGFYFFVNDSRQTVYARFYIGRQRTKTGLRNIVSQIRLERAATGAIINQANSGFTIMFIASDKMKNLTTAFGKGKVAKAFTRAHNDAFQNLEEMNRMLNDNFKFYAQKY